MAKKGTTGGPRVHKTTQQDVERRREYKSRAERERMWQRRLMWVIGALVALSVVILIIAIVNEQVLVPRQAITTVNEDEVTTEEYQERVRFTRWLTANQIREAYFYLGGDVNTLQQYVGQQISDLQRPSIIGSQVLEEMEEELVLVQGAEELDVQVDEARVDEEVESYMADRVGLVHPGLPTPTPTVEPTAEPTRLVPSATPRPTSTPTAAPTATPRVDEEGNALPTYTPTDEPEPTVEPSITPTFEPSAVLATIESEQEAWLDDATDVSEVDRETVRELFYYQALREAVRDELAEEVSTEELQVNARHMLFSFNPEAQEQGMPLAPTEEEKTAALERAEAAMDALQEGEPFAMLARELSDDTGSATQGGELGWTSPDEFVGPFEEAVLNAELGDIVGPIETEFGYHIIQVHDRGVRELSETALQTRQNERYQNWLEERKAEAEIDRHDDWLDRIPDEPTYNDLLGDILPVN